MVANAPADSCFWDRHPSTCCDSRARAWRADWEHVALHPFDVLETAPDEETLTTLWRRGGFPDSFLAASDADSIAYRQNFIATYLERDIPQLWPGRIPAATLERLWRMLAHGQAALLNASALATSLSISAPMVTRYVDLLVDLLLVRRLPPLLPTPASGSSSHTRCTFETVDWSMRCSALKTTTHSPDIR